MKPHQIWPEQCVAARAIQVEFGTDRAISYLVGEKFINCLDAAETDEAFRKEIPEFVAEIRDIFERWQLAAYLDIARQTERCRHDFHEVATVDGIGFRGALRKFTLDPLLEGGGFRKVVETAPVTRSGKVAFLRFGMLENSFTHR